MKHVGDITKLHGWELEPVDCITGGSPCQDLSLAGKRAGLAGERSGLFMEQIRLIKEMRDATRHTMAVRPRYMVWENVAGAFSSNGGKDFKAVLEETIRIAEPEAPDVPMPGGGGWPKCGCLYSEVGKWSIAWRLHDAQYWGVPQRRKRIALVADFGGLSAPEVLLERKGLRWDTAESRDEGQGAAGNPAAGAGEAISFQERAGKPGGGKGILIQDEHTGALSTLNKQSVCYGISSYDSNAMKSDNPRSGIYEADTSRTLDLNGGNPGCNQGGMAVVALEGNSQPMVVNEPYVYQREFGGKVSQTGKTSTLEAAAGEGGNNMPIVLESNQNHATAKPTETSPALKAAGGEGGGHVPMVISFGNGQLHDAMTPSEEVSKTLNCMDDPAKIVTWGIDRAAYNQGQNAQFKPQFDRDLSASVIARGPNAVATHTVRRLTPTECERLQNFPDGWTDIGDWTDSKGKLHKASDSARYKALGNSIALPFWFYLLRRISAQYERPATLGSLFSGIGGFELCWTRCNGSENVRWSSEIEEFAIAVCKKHFGDEETGETGDVGQYL